MRTNAQNRRLHWLLAELNIPDDVKKDLVHQFTNGEDESSSGLSVVQADALNEHLYKIYKEKKYASRGASTVRVDDPAQRMRRKVISLCYDLHMTLPSGKIDMDRVNALCKEKGFRHVLLNDYKQHELPILITQVERMVRDFLKAKK